MPESAPGTDGTAAPQAAAGPAREVAAEAQPPVTAEAQPPTDAGRAPRTSWFYYGLGLSLQTFLWFLLFLAIIVAVAVGGKLTEFRYVGF
jgi:hypothetical protein